MRIRFLFDTVLEVIESYDEEADEAETSMETFKAGEIHDIDPLDPDDEEMKAEYIGFQFGDGSCAYGVPRNLFEVLDNVP